MIVKFVAAGTISVPFNAIETICVKLVDAGIIEEKPLGKKPSRLSLATITSIGSLDEHPATTRAIRKLVSTVFIRVSILPNMK